MNRVQKLKTMLGLNRFDTYLARMERDASIKRLAARHYSMDTFQSLRFPTDARIVFYSNDPKAELALQS